MKTPIYIHIYTNYINNRNKDGGPRYSKIYNSNLSIQDYISECEKIDERFSSATKPRVTHIQRTMHNSDGTYQRTKQGHIKLETVYWKS